MDSSEMSFAMGRPDSLGADKYHNRMFPVITDGTPADATHNQLLEPSHCAIIKCMVDFSRITRSVCLNIYLSESPAPATIDVVQQIEQDLDHWVKSVPEAIRPDPRHGPSTSLRSAKDPQWVKRQRLVLNIRSSDCPGHP